MSEGAEQDKPEERQSADSNREPQEPPGAADAKLEEALLPPRLSKEIAKTLLEDKEGVCSQSQECSAHSTSSPDIPAVPPSTVQLPPRLSKDVARTKLDKQAIQQMADRAFEEKEHKIQEQLSARANEPSQPFIPISDYKEASPCGQSWKDPGSETVGFCERCKMQVYNFAGMQLPEAEELIFKRENRRQFILYKRSDGIYLTRDCPFGIQKKLFKMLSIAGAACLLLGLFSLFLMMPPTPPQTAQIPDSDSSPPIIQPLARPEPGLPPRKSPPMYMPENGAPPPVSELPNQKYLSKQPEMDLIDLSGSVTPPVQPAQPGLAAH